VTDALLDAAAALLADVPVAALAAAYARISAGYRAGGATPVAASEVDVLAYAAARLPATYAVVSRVLADVSSGLPSFAPASVLDLGAGPGTAGWAAVAAFRSVSAVTFVEQSAAMASLGRRLASSAGAPAAVAAAGTWEAGDAAAPPGTASLVVASYVLGELPVAARAGAVRAWWAAASDVLVVVEPGTPAGWRGVREARSALVAAGAYVVGACPLAPGCAAEEEDWCHFAARVERSRLHRRLKDGTLGFEDEKYAWVAVSRAPAVAAARVAGEPERHGGHVRLRVCGAGGVAVRVVSKRDAAAYRWARQARWGDRVADDVADDLANEVAGGAPDEVAGGPERGRA
jgi:ribosomal protein RSM22 (predicted rRNA methylase)